MYKLCVFAGTTEGRRLVELLADAPVEVTACVATEYGEALLTPRDRLTVSHRRLTEEEMEAISLEDRNCRLIKGQVFLWKGAGGWEDLWDPEGVIVQ